MLTSGSLSSDPPNHAATKPSSVLTIVEAWHEANGALSKINSLTTKIFSCVVPL